MIFNKVIYFQETKATADAEKKAAEAERRAIQVQTGDQKKGLLGRLNPVGKIVLKNTENDVMLTNVIKRRSL